MMVEIVSSRLVTTRAPHHCWGCKNPSAIGQKMERTVCVDMGCISSIYWCDTCSKFINTLDVYDTDGFEFGELAEMEGYPDTP